jgi:hypothetical protein
MEELEILKREIALLKKETEVNNKANFIEFEKVGKAFQEIGNLVDLLYLEVSVMIETLTKKSIFTQEEFTSALKETAEKVQEHMEEQSKEKTNPEKL